MTLTHVGMFDGIGGFELAMAESGIPTIAGAEIDPKARGVLHDRFPHTHIYTDVKEMTGDSLRSLGAEPARTVLSAGWPCQGNSVAGRRGGLTDPRSGLWREVVRVLTEFRPAWFVGENVPGLLSVNDGRDFAAVIGDVAELGYGFAWRVLDAQHFGVPQRRRRVVIVGRFGDSGRAPAQVLLEPEGLPGNPAESITPRPIFARRTDGSAEPRRISHALTGEGFDASEDGTGRGTPIIAATLTAGQSSPGTSAPGRRQEDDYNLVSYTAKIANTLDTAQGGADDNSAQAGHLISDGVVVRRLTPLEKCRLQGYPDGHTATSDGKPQSDSAQYKQHGNGIAVPVFAWVARRIAAVDHEVDA